ncbi:F-box/kelch-repeat protein At3g16740-like [Apium graveolens]|uniref:F-box/kelch-repeat protein At3g16740-like n=1 Tax=Apium graveolens TaxID=4045 RepID=UPI003D791705
MASTFNDIPDELLIKIFYLQPMNSLVLLRNVCKLWDQIISSEYFNGFLLARERTSSNTSKYLLLEGFRGSKSTSLVDSDKHVYYDIPLKNFVCYGICDGLLCLSPIIDRSKAADSAIILWNPIFRKTLPPLEIEDEKLTYVCFGHHDDDYKVIKLVLFRCMYFVCTYSLSSDSWKVKKFDGVVSRDYNYEYLLRSWSKRFSKGRLVNGAAYFFQSSREYYNPRLLSIDINSVIVRERELECLDSRGSDFILEEYGESLAFIQCILTDGDLEWRERDGVTVAMWVLRESTDNSFSWEEMLVVELKTEAQNNYDFQALGFINKDEVVIRRTAPNAKQKYSFFLYSLENRCLQKFTAPEPRATMVQSFSNGRVNGEFSGFDNSMEYFKPVSLP